MALNPVAVLRQAVRIGDKPAIYHLLQLWCPGCDDLHQVNVPGPDGFRPSTCWDWDGNLDQPTIDPSILVQGGADGRRCHSYVRTGHWEFLDDSNHRLAGQRVPLVPLPDWLTKEPQ